MIQDIEDNYPEYLDEEMGYAWNAWETLSQTDIQRHDALVRSTPGQLAEIDPAGLSDFERWAYGRAARRQGDTEGFLDAARLILASEDNHPGLAYHEVFLHTIDAMAAAQLFDEASLHMATFRERWPDDPDGDRLEAMITYRQDAEKGRRHLETLRSTHPDDPELQFEVAEDLNALGATDDARHWLDIASATATRTGNRAVLVDIELIDMDVRAPRGEGNEER